MKEEAVRVRRAGAKQEGSFEEAVGGMTALAFLLYIAFNVVASATG
jgi:hypothetical protein